MVSKALTLVLQIIGYVFTLGEAIAPAIITFRRIVAENTVGPNSCFPYELIWFNGLMQLVHAVRKHDNKWAISVYSIVVIITSVYCLAYLWYSNDGNRKIAWLMFALKSVFVAGVLALEFTHFADKNSDKVDGVHDMVVFVITLLMYFSPAQEVWQAYKSHDVGGLDIVLSLAFLCNAIISIAAACLPVNVLSIIGGLAGIICAAVQIFVWRRCFYHDHRAHVHPLAKLLHFMGHP